MARSYSHYCPIAHALDLVGERWSLLVVRELQHGPLRYTDLLEQLPGVSTNVLAARLRELELGGILGRRRMPAPAASAVYELTELGQGLTPVLTALAHWGAHSLGPPPPDAESCLGGSSGRCVQRSARPRRAVVSSSTSATRSLPWWTASSRPG